MRIYQDTRAIQNWGCSGHFTTSHTVDCVPFGIGYRYTHTYTYNGKRNKADSGNRYQASLPNGWVVSVSNLGTCYSDLWSVAVLDQFGEFVELPEWLPRALGGEPVLFCVEIDAEMSPDAFAEIYHAAACAVAQLEGGAA